MPLGLSLGLPWCYWFQISPWIFRFMSLDQFRKYSAIIWDFQPHGLSPFSATLMTWMLDMLQSHKSLRLFIVSQCMFCCSYWLVSVVSSSTSRIHFSSPPFCHWAQSRCFVFLLYFALLQFPFVLYIIYLLAENVSLPRLLFHFFRMCS